MYSTSQQPRLSLGVNISKAVVLNAESVKSSGGALSPDIVPSQPSLLFHQEVGAPCTKQIGRYVVHGITDNHSSSLTCKAVDPASNLEYVCKIYPLHKYTEVLSPYWSVGPHKHLNNLLDTCVDSSHTYLFFHACHEDLHSYVRRVRKMSDAEACRLFSQVVSVVRHCHQHNVVLRDLKLRKFVFKDASHTHLVLDNLEDCHLDDGTDVLCDRHGCPAYVSPEILHSTAGYSGKAADAWSLGVILYAMLVGQYPFHDADVCQLFKKIRQGIYVLPESLSAKACCLLKNLLRVECGERMSTCEILSHVWFEGRSGDDDDDDDDFISAGAAGRGGGGGFGVVSGGGSGGSGRVNEANWTAVLSPTTTNLPQNVYNNNRQANNNHNIRATNNHTGTNNNNHNNNYTGTNNNNYTGTNNNINTATTNNSNTATTNNNNTATTNNNNTETTNNNNSLHGNNTSPFVTAGLLFRRGSSLFSHNNINNTNSMNNNNNNIVSFINNDVTYRNVIMSHINNSAISNNNHNNNNHNWMATNRQEDCMDDQTVPEWMEE